jgi:hypothetical protein
MSERKHDYIPRNAAQFRFFMSHIMEYTTKMSPEWTAIPHDRIDELYALHGIFSNLFDLVIADPTPGNISKRNEAQTEAAKALRAFVRQYLRFPPVTNSDRIEMGIPNHDTIRTDHTVVTEEVDFVIQVASQRELSIEFWQKGQTHKAKPHNYDGAVIEWDILDSPPANQDDLTHHAMASRTPYPLHFTEEERGRRVYVALRWQNERGILGQWSDIKEAVVP